MFFKKIFQQMTRLVRKFTLYDSRRKMRTQIDEVFKISSIFRTKKVLHGISELNRYHL